jgi:hypothetical protein
MRFSIRDLLWATLVVGMGVAWWMSYRALDAKRLAAVTQASRLWALVDAISAKEKLERETGIGMHGFPPDHAHVDLRVLNEPRVEP